MSFKSLSLYTEFEGFFNEKNFQNPTQIQKRTIPLMLGKKSVLCTAETGSGKTLAYALPIFQLLKELEQKQGAHQAKAAPLAMVLAPTRELAQQIFNVMKSISHHMKLRVRLLTGGDGHSKTKALSFSSYDILIATPSRVKSSIRNKELFLGNLRIMVLDEADNLFEMGFKKDIEGMLDLSDLSMLQLGFFSATLPPAFDLFLNEKFSQKKLERVGADEENRPQTRIDTYNVRVDVEEKKMVVKMFLEKEAKGRGIIFTNQKNQADELFKFLQEKMPALKTRILHGDMTAQQREEALSAFVAKKAQVLVATDIAARGIDVEDLAWVVNYGLPKSAIYYLHRCGRVGRGGKSGVVYNLVAPHDSRMITEINQAIQSQTHLPLQMIPDAKLNEKARENAKRHAQDKVKKKALKEIALDRRSRPTDVLKSKRPDVNRKKRDPAPARRGAGRHVVGERAPKPRGRR